MHTLQALVANFEAFDDCYLNLHELNIVNLVRGGVSENTGLDRNGHQNCLEVQNDLIVVY